MKTTLISILIFGFAGQALAQTSITPTAQIRSFAADPEQITIRSRIGDVQAIEANADLQRQLLNQAGFNRSDITTLVDVARKLNRDFANPALRRKAKQAFRLKESNRVVEGIELQNDYYKEIFKLNDACYERLCATLSEEQWEQIAKTIRTSKDLSGRADTDGDPLDLPETLADTLQMDEADRQLLRESTTSARVRHDLALQEARITALRRIAASLNSEKGLPIKRRIEQEIEKANRGKQQSHSK